MIERDFDHLWNLQEIFYEDRPLMWAQNQNVLSLLDRIRDEATECQEAILKCAQSMDVSDCVDLLNEDIRQEVADSLLFVMGLAKCLGITGPEMVADAITKIARNMGRYPASEFKDLATNYDDIAANARSWDKRRRYSEQFYAPDSHVIFTSS